MTYKQLLKTCTNAYAKALKNRVDPETILIEITAADLAEITADPEFLFIHNPPPNADEEFRVNGVRVIARSEEDA